MSITTTFGTKGDHLSQRRVAARRARHLEVLAQKRLQAGANSSESSTTSTRSRSVPGSHVLSARMMSPQRSANAQDS
jgi:hypothetical protein